MAKEVTQKDRVLEYIKRTGSITAYEAIKDLGILQLSARLVELEHEGYSFSKKPETAINRFGEIVHYIRYGLMED